MAARLDTLLRRAGRDLFLPLTFRLAQRLEQVTAEEFAADPALAAFALRSAQKLFGADGTVNWFEPGFEGADSADDSALLARPPVSVALDLARRLAADSGKDDAVLGFMTGPARGFGGKVSLALAKAYCEANVSALLLAEEAPLGRDAADHCDALAPLVNLATYYGIPVLLLPRQPPHAEILTRLRSTGVRVAGPDSGEIITLPIGETDAIDRLARWQTGSGRLVLSAWDIPPETAPKDVVAAGRRVRG
jgi:hypothetical protein